MIATFLSEESYYVHLTQPTKARRIEKKEVDINSFIRCEMLTVRL